jgi:predicted nicotinamide N-methyase
VAILLDDPVTLLPAFEATLLCMNFTPHLEIIRLHDQDFKLYVPSAKEVHDAYINKTIDFPFWAQVWPSSKALAVFILDHPETVKNKKVLELGAGLGLPSLIAARWATSVVCSDHDASAIEFVDLSVQYHQLKNINTCLLDWAILPPGMETDVILLSDINYDPSAFDSQQKLILSFLKKNISILLSTPQRLMGKSFLLPLMNYCRHNEEVIIQHGEKEVIISVMVFKI